MLKPAYFNAETFFGSLYQEERLYWRVLPGLQKGPSRLQNTMSLLRRKGTTRSKTPSGFSLLLSWTRPPVWVMKPLTKTSPVPTKDSSLSAICSLLPEECAGAVRAAAGHAALSYQVRAHCQELKRRVA